jgi:hypothetical protein
MMKNILQDCLARLERGETLEQVLADCASPTERDELASLLTLATNVRHAAPTMSQDAKARVRYQVYGAMRVTPLRARRTWQTWLARVALVCVVVLLLGSSTFVAVAESAPGKPLFPARAAFNETRARITTHPRTAILLTLQNAEERLQDVQIRKQRHQLNEAAIFWMVGETENLMVALENRPQIVDRAILERAQRLVLEERALLRDLIKTAPQERARRNAETLYQLSEGWLFLINRLLDQTR